MPPNDDFIPFNEKGGTCTACGTAGQGYGSSRQHEFRAVDLEQVGQQPVCQFIIVTCHRCHHSWLMAPANAKQQPTKSYYIAET